MSKGRMKRVDLTGDVILIRVRDETKLVGEDVVFRDKVFVRDKSFNFDCWVELEGGYGSLRKMEDESVFSS
jgi:hypothetical protein